MRSIDSRWVSQSDDPCQSISRQASRRSFLQATATLALTAAARPVSALGKLGTSLGPLHADVRIPPHLPRRLTICYYGWAWITAPLPDEPFGNLDLVLRQTKERGFNCVRAEMGLNWMFDLQGRRRGKLRFTDWIPGFSSNLQCVNGRGGGDCDVYERVIQLFELSAKHGLYVIMTSWEYQDALSQLADSRIRDEILAVPYSERLMLLARQYDRLLADLRRRGLHKYVAQVELINELNSPPILCSMGKLPPETMEEWKQGKLPTPRCAPSEVRNLAYGAVAYLREKNPDLLITVDGLVACNGFATLYPRNAQVADHHVYSDGVVQAFWEKCGIVEFGHARPPGLEQNPFLKSVLKPNPVTWDAFIKRAGRVRQVWWDIGWLYANLDNEKFDQWCVAHFQAYEQKIKDSMEKQFECAAKFAKARNLPLIVDEGFILYPPLNSRFVATPEGRRGEEYGVDAAIATGHWGITISGYFRPDTPLWTDDGQSEWAKNTNNRVLKSA